MLSVIADLNDSLTKVINLRIIQTSMIKASIETTRFPRNFQKINTIIKIPNKSRNDYRRDCLRIFRQFIINLTISTPPNNTFVFRIPPLIPPRQSRHGDSSRGSRSGDKPQPSYPIHETPCTIPDNRPQLTIRAHWQHVAFCHM